MDYTRSRSLSRPPPYDCTPPRSPQHQRASSGSNITPLAALSSSSIGTTLTKTRTAPPPRRRPSPGLVPASFLEPRIAVVLNISKRWRPWLFFSRLLSICPAIFWGVRPALQLVLRALLALPLSALLEAAAGVGVNVGDVAACQDQWRGGHAVQAQTTCPAGDFHGNLGGWPTPRPKAALYPWTEMILGTIWVRRI